MREIQGINTPLFIIFDLFSLQIIQELCKETKESPLSDSDSDLQSSIDASENMVCIVIRHRSHFE